MTAYRCYLMSGDRIRIQAVQAIEGADDAEVIRKAAALLDAKPVHQNVEIWEGKRMVARVPRRDQSARTLKIVARGEKKDGEDPPTP